jgi:hypothetical protein
MSNSGIVVSESCICLESQCGCIFKSNGSWKFDIACPDCHVQNTAPRLRCPTCRKFRKVSRTNTLQEAFPKFLYECEECEARPSSES